METLKTSDTNMLVLLDCDKRRARVLDKKALESQRDAIRAVLAEMPEEEVLLKWAKENYTHENYDALERQLAEIETDLKAFEEPK